MRLFNILSTSFENFDETMKSFLNKVFGKEGQEYSKANIFSVVFEGIKGVMQNMMFYIEDAVTEQNVFTATRKKSVYSLAKISGYDPWYGSAATGTVLISSKITNGTGAASSKILIPNYTTLQDKSSGTVYTLMLSNDYIMLDLNLPLTSYDVKFVEGSWRTATAVAEGNAMETLTITPHGLFDKNYLDVYVNGEKWSATGCVYDMTEDSKEYVVTSNFDGNILLVFGDGVYGRKLSEGDNVSIMFINHNGSAGNMKITDTPELEFKDNIVDSLGNTLDGNELLNITLSNNASGGTDSDSISFVRNMIGYNSRSLVLASEDNFKMFLNRFSFIGPFNIVTYEDSLNLTVVAFSNLLQNIESVSDYYTVEEKNLLLSDYQKSVIKKSLSNSNKTFGGVSIQFVDPIIRNYSMCCYIKVDNDYEKYVVKQSISKVIGNYFLNLGTNIQYIAKSDIIKEVTDNVSNISGFDFDFISEADEIARKNGYWYKKELHKTGDTTKYVDVRQIYDKTDMIGLDEVGNLRLNTKLEMPLLHKCTMYYDDNSQAIVDPIQYFFV
jgi:hypothetical protein